MLITLTTDFGLRDPFVGLMKGVILGIAPGCVMVDLSHEIPPQNVAAGGMVIEAALDAFPSGTVHLGVVDPGVGSQRRAVAIEIELGFLVGPDNGIFTAALAKSPLRRAVQLTNPRFHRQPVSATFQGRDIFAPVAAHLARGVPLEQLGETIDQLQLLPLPHPVESHGSLQVHVVSIDWFGNLITDLTARDLSQWKGDVPNSAVVISWGPIRIAGIQRTFADVEVDRPLAYFGSTGRLEIGMRNGNAAMTFVATVGTVFRLTMPR